MATNQTTTVDVPAIKAGQKTLQELWTDSGVSFSGAPTPLTITATGTAYRHKTYGSEPTGSGAIATSAFLAPGLPAHSLVGRIGDGAPFLVGASYSATINVAGKLFLAFNDENWADNSGKFVATVSVPQTLAALDLDGTNDWVRLPPDTYFKGDFTIEAWVYVKKISNWGSLVDFTSKEAAGDNQVTLYLSAKTSGKPGIAVQGAGGVSEHTNLDCDSALTLNRWTHIAATLSGTTGSFYIDGVKVNTTIRDPGGKVLTAMARPADVVRNYAAIARPTWFPNEALGNVKIDELRIWSVARTPEQIVANMNRELGAEQGLVAYYKFNEGNPGADNSAIAGGQEIKDSAGGHHGSMQGFAKTGAGSNWVGPPPNLK
jgi:hypothetical protein